MSNTFNNDFNLFVEERINNAITNLKNTSQTYDTKLNDFNTQCKNLRKDLTPEQIEQLDNLIAISNSINVYELSFIYKTAISDFLDFKEKKFF